MERMLDHQGYYRKRGQDKVLFDFRDVGGHYAGVQIDLKALEQMMQTACESGCARSSSGPVVVMAQPWRQNRR